MNSFPNIRLFAPKGFIALILVIGISGCGPQTSGGEVSPQASSTKESVGTNGQLIAIQSNNVSEAGYNASTLVMTVRFKNGALYEYYGVPAELWNSFIAAQPHPWSQVGYPRLVRGGIPYKRIG